MLNWHQRDYLVNLARRDLGRRRRTLERARKHDGQTREEFDDAMVALRAKIEFQESLVGLLEDDEEWDDDNQSEGAT